MHYASQVVVETESVLIAHSLSDLTSSTLQVACTHTRASVAALLLIIMQHLGESDREQSECCRKGYLAGRQEGLLASCLTQVLTRPESCCCCWSRRLPSSRLKPKGCSCTSLEVGTEAGLPGLPAGPGLLSHHNNNHVTYPKCDVTHEPQSAVCRQAAVIAWRAGKAAAACCRHEGLLAVMPVRVQVNLAP